jgi:hypothetical protein
MQAGRPAGHVCAEPRSSALEADPAVIGARKEHSPRVQAIDLTEVFCSLRACNPVIGGALVYKDLHHFTLTFAETLAAPLGRKLDALMQAWPASSR